MKLINKILLQEIGKDKRDLSTVIAMTLLIVGFDVIAPWPFKILIDNVLNVQPLDIHTAIDFLNRIFSSRYVLGFFAVFVYFGSTFLLSIVEYLNSTLIKRVIKNITANFSKSAFKNLEKIAIGFYKKQQIGDYIYRLSYDVSAIGEFIEEGVLPLITSFLYLIITVVIMLLIDVNLTLISLAAVPVLALSLYSFNSIIEKITKRSEYFSSAFFSFIEEALGHLKIIQAFNQERRQEKIFGRKTETTFGTDVAMYRLDFLLTLLVGIIIAIAYSVIIIYGIQAVFSGVLTTGLLIVFIFYLDNLTHPILSIIYSATALRQNYVKIARMNDFFTSKTHLMNTGNVKEITDATIKFRHVSLDGDKGAKILSNLSFEIPDGKKTVIFGANGSGKTSVVNLILRFIDKPSLGKITIGGIPLESHDVKTLRDNISFVPQEITLFSDTIKNNIAFGNPAASLAEIKEAAKLAHADEFIQKLPGHYHYNVGEGGQLVSGGQRQRLMLARAFLKKDAKILLFDETLSALDVKTRREVIKTIHNFSRNKTVIIVSNIFDIVKAADNVIVLDKGKVIYSGPKYKLPREFVLYKMMLEND